MWGVRTVCIRAVSLLAGVLGCAKAPDTTVDPPNTITNTLGMKLVTVDPPNAITNTLDMKLVLIPAGEFLMGSPDSDKEASEEEKPQHRVRLTQPFYLGMTEVTQEQFKRVMGRNPSFFSAGGEGKHRVKGDTRRLPVETVSWDEAIEFCNKLSEREGLKSYYQSGERDQSGGDGYRLPTEAEWEYACRAESMTRYCFGDDPAEGLSRYACYELNSQGRTDPVGQKRPNAFSLYDMHGNVSEWCQDGYSTDYYQGSPAEDPQGPSGVSERVVRGGCWAGFEPTATSTYRYGDKPGARINFQGFRVARGRVQSASAR